MEETNKTGLLSVVLPAYNEEASVPRAAQVICGLLTGAGIAHELIFVDDGSRDGTLNILRELAARAENVHYLSFSRNFGKEAGMLAGLRKSSGDYVAVMDVDLQDPPSLIPAFLEKYREGYDIVYGQRQNRRQDSFLKRFTARCFYKFYNVIASRPMPENAGDCRLLNRRAIQAVLALPERERFMKGLFNWVGFRTAPVPFTRQPRRAGKTKWNYWQLWNFALEGLTASSTIPLRLWTYFGFAVSGFAFLYAVWVAVQKMVYGNPVSGYASLMVTILFFSGVQLISLGVLGEYLGRIFIEVKQRPLYFIAEKINCD